MRSTAPPLPRDVIITPCSPVQGDIWCLRGREERGAGGFSSRGSGSIIYSGKESDTRESHAGDPVQ